MVIHRSDAKWNESGEIASADRRNHQLVANLHGQTVVNLRVPGNGGFRTRDRVGKNRMPRAFPLNLASMGRQISHEFVALHPLVPANTPSGTSSTRSASKSVAFGSGAGNATPSSSRISARSSIALAIISRASGKSKPWLMAPGKSRASATTIWPALFGSR